MTLFQTLVFICFPVCPSVIGGSVLVQIIWCCTVSLTFEQSCLSSHNYRVVFCLLKNPTNWWIGLSCVVLSLSFERQLLLVRVKTTVKFRWFWAWLMPCAWKGCEMTVHTGSRWKAHATYIANMSVPVTPTDAYILPPTQPSEVKQTLWWRNDKKWV